MSKRAWRIHPMSIAVIAVWGLYVAVAAGLSWWHS